MRRKLLFPLLFASTALAQQRSTNHDMSQMHRAQQRGGFMQGGMQHTLAKGVLLDAKTDAASHTITLRVGPMNLPANTSHMKMPQPADLVWTIPLSSWLLAYHAKLVDANGGPVPGTVLHHVAFWNENRSDFLCPNKEEHIFGAGGELTDWAVIPGFGYRVEKGDRIRIETMIHNPTAIAYNQVYLEVAIPYLDDAQSNPEKGAQVKSVYPTWIDVGVCGHSSYDLPAGATSKSGTVPVKYSGTLLGVGGHLHDYGRQLTLEVSGVETVQTQLPDPHVEGVRRNESAPFKKQVAVLDAKTDDQGLLLGIPVVTFFQTGGYKIGAGQKLIVTAKYNNPTGKTLRDGAMGIVVGYFVPNNPAALNPLRHAARLPSQNNEHHHHDE